MNKKQSVFFLFLVCHFSTLTPKKVKELIELEDLTEKTEQKKIVSSKPFNQTNSTPSQKMQQQEKKASDYFKVPVTKKDNEPKKIIMQKENSIIPVTYINEPKKETQRVARKIPIKNDITEGMITYHHWGARVPAEFSISFNDKQTIMLREKQICMPQTCIHLEENDEVSFIFKYKFSIAGYVREGGKKGRYRIPSNLQQIQTKFDWNKPHKVIIEDAELITFNDL